MRIADLDAGIEEAEKMKSEWDDTAARLNPLAFLTCFQRGTNCQGYLGFCENMPGAAAGAAAATVLICAITHVVARIEAVVAAGPAAAAAQQRQQQLQQLQVHFCKTQVPLATGSTFAKVYS